MASGMRKGAQLPFEQPRPIGTIKSAYDAAATENAQNYDDIYKNYDDILQSSKSNSSNKLNYVPINPVFTRNLQGNQYNRTGNLNTALTGLEEFSKTGGYSDSDIGNIRERAISPIRSIYDSAQRGINRQKVLSGGYSPNHGAITAKMARESSSRIGDITTGVNAEIAKMVQQGKLSGLNTLANVSSQENNLINQNNMANTKMANDVELMNAEEQRRVDDINRQMMLAFEQMNQKNEDDNTNTQLAATQGKQSLYGTTPALTSTFANQVLNNNAQNMQAQQNANMIKNQRANIGLNILGMLAGRG